MSGWRGAGPELKFGGCKFIVDDLKIWENHERVDA